MDGTVAFPLFEARWITSPVGPAALAKRTVPVVVWPPTTGLGVKPRLAIGAGCRIRVVLCEYSQKVAVMVATDCEETALVVIGKVVDVVPVGTVMVVGTVASEVLEASLTHVPILARNGF